MLPLDGETLKCGNRSQQRAAKTQQRGTVEAKGRVSSQHAGCILGGVRPGGRLPDCGKDQGRLLSLARAWKSSVWSTCLATIVAPGRIRK